MLKRIVEVAAAVIIRDDGAFLLGRRPPGGVYAGFWEFPGGKVEAGETPAQALSRELQEELGINVESAYPWIVREFIYEHAHVRLHFFRVRRWSGELRDLQHDALAWQSVGNVSVTPLLPANAPVLAALALPDFYAITHAAKVGIDAQLTALARALDQGLRLVQLRESELPGLRKAAFIHAAVDLCHRSEARVLINGDVALANDCHADGVHLTAAHMMQLESRPDIPLVAASCHNAQELAQAAHLGLDFVVVGPIKETASHPGRPGLGWNTLAAMIAEYPLPVYALGGLARTDMQEAWRAGAHGIAAIRAAWE
ncbi:MAG: Nudix family hydrolase [Proteobacteria bacterium]|nr:Nudix family hydrolase [Pseudomonadota bacterium]